MKALHNYTTAQCQNVEAKWQLPLILVFSAMLLCLTGCKKEKSGDLNKTEKEVMAIAGVANASLLNLPYCIEDAEGMFTADSILKATILGNKLNGYPYSVSAMQLAAQQVLGTSAGVGVNGWYMRFKPQTSEQLKALEDNDIDLFDYPLDYELVQEGDYYDDGSTPPETIPWLYAVVPVNFVTPAGITSQLLQQIHIPNDYRVEQKAFQNTGNYVDNADCSGTLRPTGPNSPVPPCPDPCNSLCPDYDPVVCTNGGGGGTIPAARIPSGAITVTDDIFNMPAPVRKARVVAKRFLKVERTFTNNLGQYQFTKSFRNKVKLLVKFKNGDANIRAIRGLRVWKILFPVQINMGTYRGSINNIQHNIPVNTDAHSRGARCWAAATAHNNLQEYKDYAAAQSIGLPPQNLKILLVNYNFVTASTPLYAQRVDATLTETYVKSLILGFSPWPWAGFANTIIALLKAQVDMVAGYNSNGTTLNSAAMADRIYHELTHAAHYNKVGNSWYSQFVEGEFNESALSFLTPGTTKPYGAADGYRAGYIGLGESWAYYIEHVFTNQKYSSVNITTFEQGFAYNNGNIFTVTNNIINQPAVATTGLNAHLNLLEDFSPLRTNDPFRWIPQGLFYDLVDNRNDNIQNPQRVPLVDNVSGYSNQQFFDALDNNITTIPQYKTRLLTNNNNNQAAGVNNIFTFYGY